MCGQGEERGAERGQMLGLWAGGAGAAVPAVRERVLLSLARTGWCAVKPEIICKMEREETPCVPECPGARRRHRSPEPGGYQAAAWELGGFRQHHPLGPGCSVPQGGWGAAGLRVPLPVGRGPMCPCHPRQ